jgi:hypothetical protein
MRYVVVFVLALLTAACATVGDSRGGGRQAALRPDGAAPVRVIPHQAP